jgi:thymidylate kinase
MNAAELVDRSVTDRVLVFGSLPPHGRDLDLLLQPKEWEEVGAALTDAGFFRKANLWARFEGCTTDAVETIPVADWDLDENQIDMLFKKAVSLEGYRNLARPVAADSLVILARRMVRSGGELEDKKRARVKQALEEDPDAWANAQTTGRSWGSYRAVIALERLYKSGIPTSTRKRVAALAERHRHAGRSAPVTRARRTVMRPERGRGVVTFSGLDGSGKTSQAEALAASLETTTGEAVVVWTRLSYNPSLKAIARPVKAIVSAGREKDRGDAELAPADRGKELRKKSPFVTQLWATAVAVANAASQRRMARYHLRRGRTVVCDRYTLDSRVHLRYRYGEERAFRLQARLIEALSPKPIRSYLVDVPPDVAYERKAEQYDLQQLTTQSRLYREESERMAVTRLDGTRPKDDLCSEVAEDVWRAIQPD